MNASVMIKLDTMIPFFVLFGCLMILMIHLYHSYQTQPDNLSLRVEFTFELFMKTMD
jgi:hypothetical protein